MFPLPLRKPKSTCRQRSPAPFTPIQLGGQPITPSTSVRWLGFWFDQRRTGVVHFQKRAASAAITLRSLRTLSSPAKGLTPQNVRHLVQLVLRPRLLYGASIFSPREVDLRPIRAVWHSAAHWILGAFRTTPTTSLLIEAGLPPIHLLFKHARLRYALRVACAQPTTNPAAAALPPSFPTTVPWRDPFTGRHAVPYPMTKEWNSTRTWGRPPLHMDNITSLLRPWSSHAFPTRDLVGLPRPLSLPSLPTKAGFNSDRVFPLPLSDNEILLFSDGSKAGRKVGAAFVHLHPPDSTTRSHLLPPDSAYPPIIGSHLLSLTWHISIFDAELYAASCALQYAASLSPPPKVVSLSVDNQATIHAISRPGYSYQAPLLHDICKATSTLLLSGSAVQVGWTPSHIGIIGNELADAAAKLAAEGNPPDGLNFSWSYSHLRSQTRDRLLQEWQVWHKPRDDFPFSPGTKLSAIFTLPRHTDTRLIPPTLHSRPPISCATIQIKYTPPTYRFTTL